MVEDDDNGKGPVCDRDFDEAPISAYAAFKPRQDLSPVNAGAVRVAAAPLEWCAPYMPWRILLVSAATRYYRLDEPRGVVFDEGHFGRFTNQYNDRQFLFDIHPPMGKLVFHWVSLLAGYDWRVCDYSPKTHTELYDPTCKYIVVRATAAFFGTWTPLFAYAIARNWSASVPAAALAALFVIADVLNVIEARLILIDSQLMFWNAASLLLAQHWWSRWNEHSVAMEAFTARTGREYGVQTDDWEASGRDPRLLRAGERWRWCIACGIVFANAISIKWTGLATPGEFCHSRHHPPQPLPFDQHYPLFPLDQHSRASTMYTPSLLYCTTSAAMIALESLMGLWFLRVAVPWPDLIRVATVAFLTYAHWFWWHFTVGIRTGECSSSVQCFDPCRRL